MSGSSLGGILELEEKRESRRVERDMKPRPDSDQGSNFIVVTLVMKEGGGDPIPAE